MHSFYFDFVDEFGDFNVFKDCDVSRGGKRAGIGVDENAVGVFNLNDSTLFVVKCGNVGYVWLVYDLKLENGIFLWNSVVL